MSSFPDANIHQYPGSPPISLKMGERPLTFSDGYWFGLGLGSSFCTLVAIGIGVNAALHWIGLA